MYFTGAWIEFGLRSAFDFEKEKYDSVECSVSVRTKGRFWQAEEVI